ncbi:hypothetical protein ACFLSY_01060, partial [Bacteroidota bacterium]
MKDCRKHKKCQRNLKWTLKPIPWYIIRYFPTSRALTKGFYKRAEDIIDLVSNMLGKNLDGNELINRGEVPYDVPGDWF